EYARHGYPVTDIVSHQWREAETRISQDPACAAAFLPGGRAPRPGEVVSNAALARTLEQIVEGGRDAFYSGPLAVTIAADVRARGVWLDERDLVAHGSDWVAPIETTYRGCRVLELPPNTQGLTALEMLNILERADIASLRHGSADHLHLLIETARIAYAD